MVIIFSGVNLFLFILSPLFQRYTNIKTGSIFGGQVKCAADEFLNNYNGYGLLRIGNKDEVRNCIISSVTACL